VNSSPRSLRPIDESVFTNDHAQTTKVSLSNPLERNSYAPTSYAPTSYAPSVISTVAANDGHAALSNLSLSDQNGHFKDRPYSPPPPVPSNETYGINLNGPTKSPKSPKRGLLARINTMRNREKSRNGTNGGLSPHLTNDSSSPMQSYDSPSASYDSPAVTRSPVWADARVSFFVLESLVVFYSFAFPLFYTA